MTAPDPAAGPVTTAPRARPLEAVAPTPPPGAGPEPGATTDPCAPTPGPAAAATGPSADVVAGVVTAVAVVLLGAPAGLLWAHVAPHAAFVLTPDGAGLVDPEDRAFLTADVVLGAIMLVLGVVSGLVAHAVHRAHGPAVVVGLLVGGLASAWVASHTGAMVGKDAFAAAQLAVAHGAPAGAVRRGPLQLRATGLLVVWPVAALAVVAGRTAGDVRREREQGARRVSSG